MINLNKDLPTSLDRDFREALNTNFEKIEQAINNPSAELSPEEIGAPISSGDSSAEGLLIACSIFSKFVFRASRKSRSKLVGKSLFKLIMISSSLYSLIFQFVELFFQLVELVDHFVHAVLLSAQ